MDTAVDAVGPPALTEHQQPSAHSGANAGTSTLVLGSVVLLECAWLGGIGYFVYWLLS